LPSLARAGLACQTGIIILKNDAGTLAIIKAYQNYIRQLLQYTGNDSATAAKKALQVYGLEKRNCRQP